MSTTGIAFAVNERVLCYHGPLMYEAKILKTEMWDETNTKLAGVGPHFFVHYKGWKQTCVRLAFLLALSLSPYVFFVCLLFCLLPWPWSPV